MKQSRRYPTSPGFGLARVGAALFLLAVIAAGVGSNVDRGAAAPGWPSLVIVAVAGVAALGGVLFVVWASGYAAFAGTSVRGKAQLLAGIGVATLIGCFLLVVLPRLGTGEPRFFSGRGKACIDGGFFWLHFPSRRAELFRDTSGRFCWPSGGVKVGGGAGGGAAGEMSGTLLAVAGASVLALVVVAVAAAAAARRSRRRRSPVIEEDTAVLQALDESLDDLRRERDVRRAIVACYARMERALAGTGRARRAHETPLEFLARVLERVGREPGQMLTELFERARFSVEPMGESDKRSAIAALEQLRTRVAG